ncbi:hypothetical protein [Lysobacter gummosus]|uniref:hypothetical protein n=1 Tax=Lysobacter gummosus TaxID=262324 RepID=UPI0036358865
MRPPRPPPRIDRFARHECARIAAAPLRRGPIAISVAAGAAGRTGCPVWRPLL